MNLQTHHLGQIPGQVPNQAGTMLPALPQQNGNPVTSQMQNHNVHRNSQSMDPGILKVRGYMREKIFEFIMQRQQNSHEVPRQRMNDIVRRLEEGLIKTAQSKEDYMNPATLDNRLLHLIRSYHNPQLSRGNASSTIGTMIPTPGFQQTGNSSVVGASSADSSVIPTNSSNTIVSPTVSSGSLLPGRSGSSGSLHGGSFSNVDGALASGYQQSSPAFSINSRVNNTVTSMSAQRTSQMIPTPGINYSNHNDLNINAKNTRTNVDLSNNGGAGVESTSVSQLMLQKQHVGGQNSRILHNIGGHMGGGIRSTLQQKSFGLSNGSLNGGLGMLGKNMPVVNGPGITEGHLTGDGYGIGAADASGSGNLYAPMTSVGLMMNNQSLNTGSMPKPTTPLINLSNAYSTQQVTTLEPQSMDQSEKVHFQSQYSVKETLVQPRQHQQFQRPSYQFQSREMAQHHGEQEMQLENQLLVKSESLGQSQVSSPFHFSEIENQFQNSLEDHSGATQLLSHTSGPQNICSSLGQSTGQMHQLHQQQFVGNPISEFVVFSCGIQPDVALCDQQNKSQDVQKSGRFPVDQSVEDVSRHRLAGQDVAQPNNLSSEESVIGQSDTFKSAEPLNMSNTLYRSNTIPREKQIKNQQKWLLYLRHARRCPAPEGKCLSPQCFTVQQLLKHMEHCNVYQCTYPRCNATKALVTHKRGCRAPNCPVCIPVNNFIQAQLKARACSDYNSVLHTSVNGSTYPQDTAETVGRSVVDGTPEDLQPPIKRIKVEQGSMSVSESVLPVALASTINDCHSQGAEHTEQHYDLILKKSVIAEVKSEGPGIVGQLNPKNIKVKDDKMDDVYIQSPEVDPVAPNNPGGSVTQEIIKTEKEMEQAKLEIIPVPSESVPKTGKPKVKGVSMIELFTPEEVRQHIMGLRQWVGQSKAKAERNQAMEHSMSENSCQLCAVEKLTFEPPPIYCTPCGARIKRNAMYYTIGGGETRHCFCIPCYNNEARGDTIVVDGTTVPKAKVEKKKNDEETEEWWVQCDKCEAWQHQICALFNGRRNDGGQAEYTCPNCYVAEVERGERLPLPHSAVLGAKDLPRTNLSDHLENRLFAKLKQERQDRARLQGKSYDEVAGAEALVVRVVSSVDKKLDVKPRFLEIFQEENYPTEFPYKSKVVLLFQRIEGVEVCLFGMYVQEFGSECEQPNHRRVYLSYLDSVKYFRPEVRAVTGEALRTFVYHEILIGYLEYCKMRGFTSCYIWACPPLKGEDYILYCHPEIQKTPKSDKLREWYLSMLRKATRENIVVELTNLYEHFFVSTGECKAKVTAARLPYFDGDYWPGAAEDIIYQLQQEDDGRKPNKKGIMKKSITKRALKASGQTDLSGNASKDLMLMHKLGETISPMKEDFIMVHLQHACSHCCTLMVSGTRWVCKQCKNFQLCDKCYIAERTREDRDRHPIYQKDKHALYSVEITGVPDDTKDNEVLESEFFDTRQAFLSLCQGNHYQYDTLRRAKHSSMMVLYHLHNPTAPAFVTSCIICHLDIEAGHGWRCETCPDYEICNACHQKNGGIDHPHKLTNHQSSDHDAQNKEARQSRVTQLRKMLELLVHASVCRSLLCQYPNCRKVKGLFRHGILCKIRATGGCHLCKKMWYLLQLHARACKVSKCNVPRCRDLKEHLRRLQQQSDSRRRAAVNEMMRQRAAEVAGNS